MDYDKNLHVLYGFLEGLTSPAEFSANSEIAQTGKYECCNKSWPPGDNLCILFGMALTSISVNSKILGGKPCIRGTRISVELLLEWLASGASAQEITTTYPEISPAAIAEALKYASAFLKNESIYEIPLIA